MTERFLPANGPAKRRQLEELREHVAGELEQAAVAAPAAPDRRLVGIGGTVRNLAAAAQRAAGLPSNGVQGMVDRARGARRAGGAARRAARRRAQHASRASSRPAPT